MTSEYSGRDELDVMRLAVNYNQSLIDSIGSHLRASDQNILDFGAGNGFFAGSIAKSFGRQLTCVEPDPILKKGIQFQGLKSVLENLDQIPDSSLDFIYSLNVLEHIEDDLGTLKILRNKLKVGGRLFLYVPAFQILYSSNDKKVGHFRRYKKAELERKCRQAQLTILESSYKDPVGFFAALVFKWLDRQKTGDINPKSLVFYDRAMYPLSSGLAPIFGSFLGKNVQVLVSRSS